MAVDYTKLREALSPLPQISGDEKTSMRVGEVTLIHVFDGTVDVSLSGAEITDVPVLDGVVVNVGSIVQMLTYRGSLLVIGTVAQTSDADASVAFSTTAITPLTGSTGTDVSIITLSHAFKAGYAYRISWQWAAQITGGTSPYAVQSKIKRSNASGTLIDDSGNQAVITTNFARITGDVVVKCTVANTTQTLCLTGAMTGSGTALDVEAASTRRIRLECRRIGTSTKYSGALEIPTA